MKKVFQEYYTPSEAELKKMLRSALIVVDTNVLLNLYRSSEKTSDEMLAALGAAKSQLWLPHQVGLEYHQHVDEVIAEVRLHHNEFEQILLGGINKLRAAFGDFRHPFIREYVLVQIDDLEERMRLEIKNEDWKIEKLNKRSARIRRAVEDLYDDASIGAPFSRDELQALYKDGEARYRDEVPPGFKDKRKTGYQPYGDLVVWKQILAKAKTEARAVVFVTEDVKDDWWLRVKGETKGPLPALRAEVQRETGQMFHAYTTEQFLRYGAPVILDRAVDSGALHDAERAIRARELRDVEALWSARLIDAARAAAVEEMQDRSEPSGLRGLAAILESFSHRHDVAELMGEPPSLEAALKDQARFAGLLKHWPTLEENHRDALFRLTHGIASRPDIANLTNLPQAILSALVKERPEIATFSRRSPAIVEAMKKRADVLASEVEATRKIGVQEDQTRSAAKATRPTKTPAVGTPRKKKL